ncbi:MAG: glycosyltransferase family 9 protein [Candidatus Eremiobacteraeota bacterium]|nr:glycosyltransferase family 9 protein [Candidatus Eremiobacteraeota bacterium]MCW5866121.1 glycosyltransferase family 9 protein [Candidatus Eremiobacteraeota bacterium]
MKKVPWAEVRRLLVTRTDHLGDLVVSTPGLKALRRHLPQAEIWCLVAQPFTSLVQNWADQVLTPADPLPGRLDAALGLSPRSATYKVLRQSRARYRIGYSYSERPLARLNCMLMLTHSWTTSLVKKPRHEAQVVAEFLESTGLGPVDIKPEFPLSPALEQWGKDKVRGRVVVHFAPRWLEAGRDKFLAMVRGLAPVLVTYGEAESKLMSFPDVDGVEWLGGLSLPQWGAVLGGGSALVSTDTGAVHVAAARGVPVVVAHLPRHYAACVKQWYPWGVPARHVILKENWPAEVASALQQL